MKKIPKGLAMLEVMIGVALAVIAIAIFLAMQSGDNAALREVALGEDVGLLINKVLDQTVEDFNYQDIGATQAYSFDDDVATNDNLTDYLGASHSYMDSLTGQNVKSVKVTIQTTGDNNAL